MVVGDVAISHLPWAMRSIITLVMSNQSILGACADSRRGWRFGELHAGIERGENFLGGLRVHRESQERSQPSRQRRSPTTNACGYPIPER